MARPRKRGLRTYRAVKSIIERKARVQPVGILHLPDNALSSRVPPLTYCLGDTVTAAAFHRMREAFIDVARAAGVRGAPMAGFDIGTIRLASERLLGGINSPIDALTQRRYERQQRLDREAVTKRAWATLRHYLTPDEQAQMDRDGYLLVQSPGTLGRTYHVPKYDSSITVHEHDNHVMTICVRPEDTTVPWADVMLAYKLGIEGAEEQWLATANKWHTRPIDGGVVTERYAPRLMTDYFIDWWRHDYNNNRLPTHQVAVDWVPSESPVVTVQRLGDGEQQEGERLRGTVQEVTLHQNRDPWSREHGSELILRDATRTLHLPCSNVRINSYVEPVAIPISPVVAAPRQDDAAPSPWAALTIQCRTHRIITADTTIDFETEAHLRATFSQAMGQRVAWTTERLLLGTDSATDFQLYDQIVRPLFEERLLLGTDSATDRDEPRV